MSNRWTVFQRKQVEIPKTTSNPLRKIKKIRQKQERYDKSLVRII